MIITIGKVIVEIAIVLAAMIVFVALTGIIIEPILVFLVIGAIDKINVPFVCLFIL